MDASPVLKSLNQYPNSQVGGVVHKIISPLVSSAWRLPGIEIRVKSTSYYHKFQSLNSFLYPYRYQKYKIVKFK